MTQFILDITPTVYFLFVVALGGSLIFWALHFYNSWLKKKQDDKFKDAIERESRINQAHAKMRSDYR